MIDLEGQGPLVSLSSFSEIVSSHRIDLYSPSGLIPSFYPVQGRYRDFALSELKELWKRPKCCQRDFERCNKKFKTALSFLKERPKCFPMMEP